MGRDLHVSIGPGYDSLRTPGARFPGVVRGSSGVAAGTRVPLAPTDDRRSPAAPEVGASTRRSSAPHAPYDRSPIGAPDIRFRLVPTSRERLRARRVAHGLIAGAARIAVESGEFGDLLADEVEADELALVLAEVENLANRHATLSRGEGEFDS